MHELKYQFNTQKKTVWNFLKFKLVGTDCSLFVFIEPTSNGVWT